MSPRVLGAAILLLTACSSAGADGEPGYETAPCVDGGCFDGLECLSDLCVSPGDDDDDDGQGGLEGGFVGTGVSESATSSSMTTTPAESGGDPSSPTNPTSLTSAASNDDSTSVESAASMESADDMPPDDDSTTGSSGGSVCGNGMIDAGEQCDGNHLGGFDCAALGLGSGDLDCDPIVCSFDTSMCIPPDPGTTSG